MDITDFLVALRALRPRVVTLKHDSLADSQPDTLPAPWPEGTGAYGDRLRVSLGTGLPDATGIDLRKAPSDESLSLALERQFPKLLEEQPLKALVGRPPDEVLKHIIFIVKDASPDALLTAVLFLARVAGVADSGDRLRPWINSVTRWNLGHMPARPFRTWPALASALSHSRFATSPSAGTRPADDSAVFQPAWDIGFSFLVESLRAGLDPERMPDQPGHRATIALRQLQQVYEHILTHATALQLSVPSRDAPGVRVTVDTLVYVEDHPSDAVKIFGCSDEKRASGGRGFKLNVTYHPKDQDWNRFTISTDPGEGLDLTALWLELERCETEAYRKAGLITRPADITAPDSATFLMGDIDVGRFAYLPMGRQGPNNFDPTDLDRLSKKNGKARVLGGLEYDVPFGVNNIWCDPWYLRRDASLIGSPGLPPAGEPIPTRLEWEDVVDRVLHVFNPLASIRVNAHVRNAERPRGDVVDLLSAPLLHVDTGERATDRLFRYVEWPKDDRYTMRGIALNDMNVRILAALAGNSGKTTPLSLKNLPPRDECMLVKLSGGFAVLSGRGSVVVDDWHDLYMNEGAIVHVMGQCATWQAQLDSHATSLEQFKTRTNAITNASGMEGDAYRLIGEVTRDRSRFSTERAEATAVPDDANARLLHDKMREFWQLVEREGHIDQGYQQIETSVKALLEARSARVLRGISILAFPAFVSPNFSKAIAYFVNDFLVAHDVIWRNLPPERYKTFMMGGEALSWLVCTGLLIWAVNYAFHAFDPLKPHSRGNGANQNNRSEID